MRTSVRTVRVASGGFAAAIALAALQAGAATGAADAGKATGAAPHDELAKKVQSAADGRGPQVTIPFADHGGIRDWRAIDRNTLLVEGTGNRWYRVELFAPCFDLPFADRVGFKANVTGELDRFSTVIVRGQPCAVQSVTATAAPPKRMKKGVEAEAGAKPADAATKPSDAPKDAGATAKSGGPGKT